MRIKRFLGLFLGFVLMVSPGVFAATNVLKVSDIVLSKGLYVDSRAYTTLAAANTAAYNAGKPLYITKNYTLTANTTLTAAVHVLAGGGFTKASTYTLTINGPLTTGAYQIFWGFDSGVTFGAGRVKTVYAEWWGALADGAVNSTAAIQAAEDAGAGITIQLQKGTYIVSSPIVHKHSRTLKGAGMSATILSMTGTGPVIKYDPAFESTLFGANIEDLQIQGNINDTVTGDGIYSSPQYGISHSVVRNVWITSCGRSGIYSSQLTSPWWNQYNLWENIFIGKILAGGNGTLSYAIYAEGGFSTNTFRNIRVHSNKRGVKVTSSGGIVPEAIVFDTVNVQDISNSGAVVHGIEIIDCWGVSILNPYIEGIGTDDTSKASSAIYVYGWATRNVTVQGGLLAAFWNGVYVDRAEGVTVDGVTYFWGGTSPATAPNGFVNIGTVAGDKETKVLNNVLAGGGSAVTYVTGSISRGEGYYDKATGDARATYGDLTTQQVSTSDILFDGTPLSGGSKTLTDYEQGSWTPVLTAANPGNLNIYYSSQIGRYTKTGRTVTLQFTIATSTFTHTTASSFVKITGIPYTCNGTIGGNNSLGEWSGITKATYTQINSQIGSSGTFIYFRASGSGVASGYLDITDLPTGGSVIIRGSITYDI